MTDDLWIVIPRWEDFQHRDSARSQVPPWIKDHTEQLSKDDYLDLTFAQRGLLGDIRKEYARSRRELSGNTLRLSRRLGQKVTKKMLQPLIDAGFITIVAGRPARTLAGIPAGVEVEIEKEKAFDLPVSRPHRQPATPAKPQPGFTHIKDLITQTLETP